MDFGVPRPIISVHRKESRKILCFNNQINNSGTFATLRGQKKNSSSKNVVQAVWVRKPTNIQELKLFCMWERTKIPPSQCAELILKKLKTFSCSFFWAQKVWKQRVKYFWQSHVHNSTINKWQTIIYLFVCVCVRSIYKAQRGKHKVLVLVGSSCFHMGNHMII